MSNDLAIHDAVEAEKLVRASVESLDHLHKQLSGSEAASVTRIRKGLRIALDRVSDVIDQLDPKNAALRRK